MPGGSGSAPPKPLRRAVHAFIGSHSTPQATFLNSPGVVGRDGLGFAAVRRKDRAGAGVEDEPRAVAEAAQMTLGDVAFARLAPGGWRVALADRVRNGNRCKCGRGRSPERYATMSRRMGSSSSGRTPGNGRAPRSSSPNWWAAA